MLRSKVAVFAELYRKSREVAAANSILSAEIEIRRRIEEQLRELNQTLEARVAERTRELRDHAARLQRANEALEQFAYAASHDLQEPLRNIAIYAELLKGRYTADLNEEAIRFLGVINEGAQRMTELVAGILEYAQSDHVDEPAPVADAEAVFAKVLLNLSRLLEESGAAISHDPLPAVAVKSFHLEQLLQNLVGNALRYRKPDEPLRVHISVLPEAGQCHLAVNDNGIGIDPEYHKKVFGLFKRLHKNRGEYPGAGMGLPICQRIVERYGGRIWVESETGRGSAFHFTLPLLSE
jgi:light-regulated signal transduction histidine kinase (bacteriophytochrome)